MKQLKKGMKSQAQSLLIGIKKAPVKLDPQSGIVQDETEPNAQIQEDSERINYFGTF